MLIRMLLLLCISLLTVAAALYLLTNDRRYLDFAWRLIRVVVGAAVLLVLLIVLERYALVGWGILRF